MKEIKEMAAIPPSALRPSLAREQAQQQAEAVRVRTEDRGRPLSLPIFRN